jgi:serine/threonine protein kinase
MPYCGHTTLASVSVALRGQAALPASGQYLVQALQANKAEEPGPDAECPPPSRAALKTLGRLTYVQAVLWLGARLADGLAHAHERGILHLDLKPANVLLGDDGQPILLDFNLAQDTKVRSTPAAAQPGGTLPYMAPEQIDAFRSSKPAGAGRHSLDGRADLYALGTLLFELLSGRLPFEALRGPIDEVLPRLQEQRRQPPPSLRAANPAVSPAVEAIVRRCLEPDRERRYPSARALAEDLDRHLDDLPLRHTREPSRCERLSKWARRHPCLT